MKADASTHEFMLLPSFQYAADQDIKLGTLLRRKNGRETRPDPSRLLNCNSQIEPTAPDPVNLEDFHFNSDEGRSNKGGVSADTSVIALLKANLGIDRDRNHSIVIDCPTVERHVFEPTDEYIAQSLKASPLMTEYIGQYWRPSAFLVTGLMIRHDPVFEERTGRSSGFETGLSMDLTTAGVPVTPGLNVGRCRNEAIAKRWKQAGRFVIAYRLYRIRCRSDGSMKSCEAFTKFALMDDEAILVERKVDVCPVRADAEMSEEDDDESNNESDCS